MICYYFPQMNIGLLTLDKFTFYKKATQEPNTNTSCHLYLTFMLHILHMSLTLRIPESHTPLEWLWIKSYLRQAAIPQNSIFLPAMSTG